MLAGVLRLECYSAHAANPDVVGHVDALGDPLPDGAVTRIGTTRLWNRGAFQAIAFTPDGRYLVTLDTAQSMKFWNPSDGKQGAPSESLHFDAKTLAYSPDGTLFAVSTVYGKVSLFDSRTREMRRELSVENRRIETLTFSVDGKYIVATLQEKTRRAGRSNGLMAWRVSDGQIAEQLGLATTVAFCAKTCTMASIMERHQIEFRNLGGSSKATHGLLTGDEPVRGMDFSSSGDVLFVAQGTELKVYGTSSGKFLRSYGPIESRPVCNIAVSPDDSMVAIFDTSNTITVFSHAAQGKQLAKLEGIEWTGSRLNRVLFSPDSRRLACSNGHDTVWLWDTQRWSSAVGWPSRHFEHFSIAPDGKTLVASGDGVNLYRMPLVQIAPVDFAPAHQMAAPISALRFRTDGSLMVADARYVSTLPPDLGHVSSTIDLGALTGGMCFDESGTTAACLGKDRLLVRSLISGELRSQLTLAPLSTNLFAFAGDQLLAFASGPGESHLRVELLDATTCRQIRELKVAARRMSISSNGQFVVTGDNDRQSGTILVIELASAQIALDLRVPEQYVDAICVSRSGDMIAAASHSRGATARIRVWSALSGQLLQTFSGHELLVRHIEFTPDGSYLVSSSIDTTLLVWSIAPKANSLSGTEKVQQLKRVPSLADQLVAGAADAHCTVSQLCNLGDEAVKGLVPLCEPVQVDDEAIGMLVHESLSVDKTVRAIAHNKLKTYGPVARPALDRALTEAGRSLSDPEFSGLIGPLTDPVVDDKSHLRTLRILRVLEQVRTPEADALIRRIAVGAPGAAATRYAQFLLKRTKRDSKQ